MAYPDDVQLQYPGQANATGEVDALYLKLFAGEVAAEYERALVALPFAQNFSLRGGKSIQLPYFGKATAAFQANGQNILDETNGLLTTIRGAEKLVYADKTLVSAQLISEWDEVMSHFNTRSVYAKAMGHALGQVSDNIVMRLAIIGANVAADNVYTGHPGGNVVTDAAAGGTAANLVAAIASLKVLFDTKDVPKDGRVLVLNPTRMQLLVTNRDLINFDYVGRDNGNLREGVVARAFGFDLVESTNMPSTNLSTNVNAAANGSATALQFNNNEITSTSAGGNVYAVDASTTVGIAFHRQGVVSVTARGLKMETKYFPELGATFVKASHIMGFSYWRPEACGVIKTA